MSASPSMQISWYLATKMWASLASPAVWMGCCLRERLKLASSLRGGGGAEKESTSVSWVVRGFNARLPLVVRRVAGAEEKEEGKENFTAPKPPRLPPKGGGGAAAAGAEKPLPKEGAGPNPAPALGPEPTPKERDVEGGGGGGATNPEMVSD